ncbi:protein kinase [bacterium]|nr:protein kinase [candidate division CSSED10-310 bacterium]
MDSLWRPGMEILGCYTLESILGRGGMGIVYLVRRAIDGKAFAVKTVLSDQLGSTGSRQSFLRELRTWMDLPDHIHLVKCCFFRTVRDRLAIFSEYVDGGSLKDRISRETPVQLSDILDIAIQIAWGLKAVHRRRLVHQDVKPANILLTRNGVVKISDFGLSRARKGGRVPDDLAARAPDVSSKGMTPAYCSPEQAAGEHLDHRTDIWSFGLCVMEMFTGPGKWVLGILAKAVLEQHLEKGSNHPGTKIPAGLVDMFDRCFRENPSDRWIDMDEIAAVLIRLYEHEIGMQYPRREPGLKLQAGESGMETGGEDQNANPLWDDPAGWLKRAYVAAGRPRTEIRRDDEGEILSLKTRALADLEIYEKAESLYQEALLDGKSEVLKEFIGVLENMIAILVDLNDDPGALLILDRIVAMYNRLISTESNPDIQDGLAKTYNKIAYLQKEMRTLPQALEMIDRSIAIREKLIFQDEHAEMMSRLSSSYSTKIEILNAMGRHREVLSYLDRTIQIDEDLLYGGINHNPESRKSWAYSLITNYVSKNLTLQELGDHSGASEYLTKAIETLEHFLKVEQFEELSLLSGFLYIKKARELKNAQAHGEAILWLDRAVSILENRLREKWVHDFASELAEACHIKGGILRETGRCAEAESAFRESIRIYEILVLQEGNEKMAEYLSSGYLDLAGCVGETREYSQALELIEKAFGIYTWLDFRDRTDASRCNLAKCRIHKADMLARAGIGQLAKPELNTAIPVLSQEYEKTGDKDILDMLIRARKLLNDH